MKMRRAASKVFELSSHPSKQRVIEALKHRRPDRIPTFDGFWEEFRNSCVRELNLPTDVDLADYFQIDICIIAADETPFPTHVQTISKDSTSRISRDGWGRVLRTRSGGYFYEELDFLIKDRKDVDRVEFDPPDLDSRYAAFCAQLVANSRRCCFCKVGGPYIRSSFMRGQENFLMDIAGDPELAAALAARVTDHLIAIGRESLRRGNLYDTGVWIYDDMAHNRQPMMSPASFERVFLPCYRRMVRAFKEAGAATVVLHSDGDIRLLLDMLVDAGIDAINPVEPKAGMHLPTLKAQLGNRLAFIGGMCNAHVLPNGTFAEIAAQARAIIEAGTEGGVIIGAHSIGPDIPVTSYVYYNHFVTTEGVLA